MTSSDAQVRHAWDRSADPVAAERLAGFSSALRTASLRAAELRRRAHVEPNKSEAWLLEALHALDHAHAELLAAQDEIHQRADELLHARVEHELEWQRYRDLFEAAPIAYLETDLRGNVIEANRRCCELLRIVPRQLQGKPLVVFIAQPDRQLFRQSLGLLALHSERAAIGLRLQPRRTCKLLSVRAEVAAVGDPAGQARALRWAFCLPGDIAPSTERSHPLAVLRLPDRSVRRIGKRPTAGRHRFRARK
jgi:PAS domain S-box-containing protein